VPDTNTFVIATFTDPDALMQAVAAVRNEDFRVYDVYSPYPIHGMDQVMGVRHSRLPWVTFLAGLAALTFALTFQFYTNVWDWPLNVGGKPDNSTLAFVPVCFELTILIGGLSTVAALFFRTRLFPGKRENLAIAGVTDDKFALVLRKRTGDMRRAIAILEQSGAKKVEQREAEL
jgi:vacuolar-type H+-ATPase subunit I/STV1